MHCTQAAPEYLLRFMGQDAQWTCRTCCGSPWVDWSVLEVMQYWLGNPVSGRKNAICWFTTWVFAPCNLQDKLAAGVWVLMRDCGELPGAGSAVGCGGGGPLVSDAPHWAMCCSAVRDVGGEVQGVSVCGLDTRGSAATN